MRAALFVGLALTVQAAAPPGRYVTSAQSVFDTKTGLHWERSPSVTLFSPADASSHCTALTADGASWRLPTVKELQSLVDVQLASPALDVTVFPSNAISKYASSTRSFLDQASIWVVDFTNGSSYTALDTSLVRVRCVH